MYNPFSLEGKTVLVTGASSGIGKATAIGCSKMGAAMIITGRNEERLSATFNELDGCDRGHRQITADLVRQDEMENLVSQIGELNGVVLCAGQGTIAPLPFCTKEKYHEIFEVNFFATVEFIRLLYKKKKIAKEGSVVFISSVGGLSRFTVGNSMYGASKAALSSVMKYCAKEFSVKGIRVNSVNPSMVKTPGFFDETVLSEEQLQEDLKRYPLKRYGEPDDIANGVIYLLSDASSWVTGTSLVIDGGVTI